MGCLSPTFVHVADPRHDRPCLLTDAGARRRGFADSSACTRHWPPQIHPGPIRQRLTPLRDIEPVTILTTAAQVIRVNRDNEMSERDVFVDVPLKRG